VAFTTGWIPGDGLSGADARCQATADLAGHVGTFRALLATEEASAASRFDSAGPPWVRPDGVPLVAPGVDLFTAQLLDAPLGVSPDGATYYGNFGVWTGAESPTSPSNGTSCANWTDGTAATSGSAGRSGMTPQYLWFANSGDAPCNSDHMLIYCLQE
jgi:hypothetical protein